MKKFSVLILIIALIFSLAGCSSADYGKANKLMEAEDYASAGDAFRVLADYKDSADKALECDYQLAKASLEGGQYEDARARFEKLGDYSDSVALALDSEYKLAAEKLSSGEYKDAMELFTKLGDYTDAAAKASEAKKAYISEKLVGKWVKNDFDIMGQIRDAVAGTDVEALFDYVKMDKLILQINMTVTDKGTYQAMLDKDVYLAEFGKYIDALKQAMIDMLMDYYDYNLTENGYTMEQLYDELNTEDPKEIIYQLEGISVDEYFDSFDFPSMLEGIATSVAENGTFEVKDEGIVFYVGLIEEYGRYDIDLDSFILEYAVQDGEKISEGYPQRFHRTE